MNIDIIKPAISTAEIETEKTRLQYELSDVASKIHNRNCLFSLVSFTLIAVSGYLNWSLDIMSWNGFFGASLILVVVSSFSNLKLGAGFFAGIFIYAATISGVVAGLFICAAAVPGDSVYTNGVFGVFGGAGAFAFAVYLANLFLVLKDKHSEIELVISRLAFAEPEHCLLIKTWLTVPEVATFRDSVQTQARKFILAEVESMESFVSSLDERAEAADRQAEINEACKEVYAGNLLSA